MCLISGKFHISEVDRWTRTPISADIGTFVVPLSTYLLIEACIKRLHRTILDKDAVLWIGYILKVIIVEEILVTQKAPTFFVKYFSRGLNVKIARTFVNVLNFSVLHDNTFYCYILRVAFLSVL